MSLQSLVSSREAEWRELELLVGQARGRPERLGAAGVLRLGALYRGAVADLARARLAAPRDPAVRALELLVVRAQGTVYPTPSRSGSLRGYLSHGYWEAVRARSRPVALAWLLLLASTVFGLVWALSDPGGASGLVPGSLTAGSPHRAIGLAAGQAAALSVSIFTNNIGVTFLAFASGILLGIAPCFVLLYNGALLGVVCGIASGAGHTAAVIELIVPHGMLELSCIAVSAAVGMRMGWAIVDPGSRTRAQSLGEEARRAVLVIIATAPWLVLAGLIEGFVTPRRLPVVAALAVGLAAAVPYWTLVGRGGVGYRRNRDLARR